MKGILYARVSTDRTIQETSLERQVKTLSRWAKELRCTVTDVIAERLSVFELNREGLFRFLDQVRNSDADAVLKRLPPRCRGSVMTCPGPRCTAGTGSGCSFKHPGGTRGIHKRSPTGRKERKSWSIGNGWRS